MDTPPPPTYTSTYTSKKKPLHDWKTPMSGNAPIRDFRSEYQPRRFATTTQEPRSTNNLVARLGSIVKNAKQQVPSTSMCSAVPSSSIAKTAITPGGVPSAVTLPSFTKQQTSTKRPIQLDEVPQPVFQPLKPHLIQDTKIAPNNRIGPIATATKAPLSVSQYTQPTPSSNKYAYQVSRAHSEPSIKYQVKVNDKTYKVLKRIGSGGSAKVYEGFEPNTYQTVAIKIINVAKADPRTKESYFNEISILSQLKNSKHVVRLYNSEYKKDCKELVIVMEKGEVDLARVLDDHFKSRDHAHIIDGLFVKTNWRGMLQAVEEIHRYGIVHADLKPVNFILVKGQLKLIDFGIASSLEPESTSIIKDYQIGTINYMAPEALRNRALDASFVAQHPSGYDQPDFCHDENNEQHQLISKKTVIKYNSKADIWSLGCILYNFVYGRPPFDKYPDIISKLQEITNPRHVINFPAINNAHLLDCMKSCLRYAPTDRPTAKELLNHDYLKDDIVILRQQQSH